MAPPRAQGAYPCDFEHVCILIFDIALPGSGQDLTFIIPSLPRPRQHIFCQQLVNDMFLKLLEHRFGTPPHSAHFPIISISPCSLHIGAEPFTW